MIYYVNKFALAIANPISVGVVVFLIGLAAARCGRPHRSFVCMLCVALWFSFWSTGICQRMLCAFLGLSQYPQVDVETLPTADVIVDLGGGLGCDKKYSKYADLSEAADRPYHAARIWKAGKAPWLVLTSIGIRDTDYGFVLDLGVPAQAVIVENESKNTEQNATYTAAALLRHPALAEIAKRRKIRALLVTSMSHMPRAMMIFKKCAPMFDCIPAATDYRSVCFWRELSVDDFLPTPYTLCKNLTVYKECLGVIGYKLRGF